MEQLFFEDVQEDAAIPHEVHFQVTTRQLVKWAGAVGDFYEVHYDKDYALAVGLPDVIVHGPLKCALLARLMTEWIGERGALRRIACQHRGMNLPREEVVCRGRVKRKYREGGENLVECEVWVENQEGAKSAPGNATVSLPSRE